jgi:hypothetical protein
MIQIKHDLAIWLDHACSFEGLKNNPNNGLLIP